MGFGHALVVICRIQEPSGLESLKAHPNFNAISSNGVYGLSYALMEYLRAFLAERKMPDDPNPDYLKAIVAHPNGHHIQFTQALSDLIGESLLYLAAQGETTFRDEDDKAVQELLNAQISHLISPNRTFGLGRVLANAAYSTVPSMVKLILLHPAANNICAGATQISKKTEAEETWNINEFGYYTAPH